MNDVIHICILVCYHLLLLLKTSLESQHTILLGKKKKCSLIHEQESCRLVKLQWMWIKFGWIITFKVNRKNHIFFLYCWALNAQLNCSYLEHGSFQKQLLGIKTISRLELCALKIFFYCFFFCVWRMDSSHSCSEGKRLLTAKLNFQHCGKQNKRPNWNFTWLSVTLLKTSLQLWTLYDFFSLVFSILIHKS